MDSIREFWHFGDQLRRANLAGISIGDNIWSDSFLSDASPAITAQKLAFANNNTDRYNNKNTKVGVIGVNGGGALKNEFNGDIKNSYNKGSGLKVGAKKGSCDGNNGAKKKNNTSNNSVLEGRGLRHCRHLSLFQGNEAVGGLLVLVGQTSIPLLGKIRNVLEESRFPAQVRVSTRKLYVNHWRRILSDQSFTTMTDRNSDWSSVFPEALDLLDKFAEMNA
ncbi:hypothetical protein J5N97_004482 [Dioscorea zingiberensis]|uniref:Uncharacterized protein n=1 Tax=Dioscorea zingiberensis TaxID=325984 RepID=A0A9D5D6R3_9LILI|nr:hypothetical protein J5N97_004482 [Dioscorea zingiberensis]